MDSMDILSFLGAAVRGPRSSELTRGKGRPDRGVRDGQRSICLLCCSSKKHSFLEKPVYSEGLGTFQQEAFVLLRK